MYMILRFFSQFLFLYFTANSLSSYKIPCDEGLIKELTRKFNESLVFDPSEVRMAYTIRDPVRNGRF